MLSQSPNITGIMPSSAATMETIKSRFGDISVDTGKALLFPRGLLGLPDKFHFVVANFPNPNMQQFTLLQSLDDKALAFITLPIQMQNAIIIHADLQVACRDLQIDETNAVILLVVTVHRGLEQVKLSVNARAPLLIDAERKTGAQYVFQQDNYKVQHML
jgi:flagellar assembly factor FliW